MNRHLLPAAALVVTACAPDAGLVVFDSPPTATIQTPIHGETLFEDQTLVLSGTVADQTTAAEDIDVHWFVGDTRVCTLTSAPDTNGTTVCETLTLESETVTLVAIDEGGESVRTTVDITVVPNQAPSVRITTPTGIPSGTVELTALLADAEDPPQALSIQWTDFGEPLSVAGGTTDSAGIYSGFAPLEPGEHQLRAEVTDTMGISTLATALITVVNADQTPPSCEFTTTEPEIGSASSPVRFNGTASDAVTVATDLTASITSNRDGTLANSTPVNEDGHLSALTTELSEGEHLMTLSVTDEAGNTCTDTQLFVVCDTVLYFDADNDGYGDPAQSVVRCDAPPAYVSNALDCDDTDPHTFPGAAPNDSASACLSDRDGDGFADASSSGSDCNDDDARIHPTAPEVCDGQDNNCSGSIDVDDPLLQGGRTVYADQDRDGFGDPNAALRVCNDPVDTHVLGNTDCDDTDPFAFPGAAFNDNLVLCLRDRDADGFGDADTPIGLSPGTDCNDDDDTIHPNADEVCDGVDNNCAGLVDEDDPDLIAPTVYPDVDGDGFGDAGSPLTVCERPSGHLDVGGDCDDTSDVVFPNAPELCDGQQNDCSVPWTSDAGTASRFDTNEDAWVDETDLLAQGTATAPLVHTFSQDTQLQMCEGTWFLALTAEAAFDLSTPPEEPDVVLDGAGMERVLTLGGPGSSRIANITVQNGSATLGGGLLASGATTYIDNVVFRDNTAASRGGAIHTNTVSSQLTVTHSTFLGNTCTTTGGGSAGGGAIHALRANLSVADSTFTGNSTGAEGGAILYQEDGAYSNIHIATTTFIGNSARNGGAVYIDHFGTDEPSITDSDFDGNSATVDGGSIFVGSAPNQPGVVHIAGSTLSNGDARRGGFLAALMPTELRESTLTTADGGCILSTEYLRLDDVQLTGCDGGENGGALRIKPSAETSVVATQVQFEDATPADVLVQAPIGESYVWPAEALDFSCDETCGLVE